MTTLTNEMNITSKEIRLVAFEAEGLDVYSNECFSSLSVRVQRIIYKAKTIGTWNTAYVIKRCIFLAKKTK